MRIVISASVVLTEPGSEATIALREEELIVPMLWLAEALHHDTCVVTADRRFAAVADLPGFAGRVRLLES